MVHFVVAPEEMNLSAHLQSIRSLVTSSLSSIIGNNNNINSTKTENESKNSQMAEDTVDGNMMMMDQEFHNMFDHHSVLPFSHSDLLDPFLHDIAQDYNENKENETKGKTIEVVDIADSDSNSMDFQPSSSSSTSITKTTNGKPNNGNSNVQVIDLEAEDSQMSISNNNNNNDGTNNSKEVEEVDLTAEDDGGDEVDNDYDSDVEIWDDECFAWDDMTEAPPAAASTSTVPVKLRSDDNDPCYFGFEKFRVLPIAPQAHKFYKETFVADNPAEFTKAYQREIKILSESLPYGILVKAYEDKMNLFSAMILGPGGTPFESVPFAFEIMLPCNYPRKPPIFHFISFTNDRINPNLYVDGKVCVSLLGTWQGRTCELWNKDSSLLQVLISIQGLILVAEPYFNEPGFERYRDAHAQESKHYNENVIIQLLKALPDMLANPPNPWQLETTVILKTEVPKIIERVQTYISGKPDAAPFRLLPFRRKYEIPPLLTKLEDSKKKYCLP